MDPGARSHRGPNRPLVGAAAAAAERRAMLEADVVHRHHRRGPRRGRHPVVRPVHDIGPSGEPLQTGHRQEVPEPSDPARGYPPRHLVYVVRDIGGQPAPSPSSPDRVERRHVHVGPPGQGSQHFGGEHADSRARQQQRRGVDGQPQCRTSFRSRMPTVWFSERVKGRIGRPPHLSCGRFASSSPTSRRRSEGFRSVPAVRTRSTGTRPRCMSSIGTSIRPPGRRPGTRPSAGRRGRSTRRGSVLRQKPRRARRGTPRRARPARPPRPTGGAFDGLVSDRGPPPSVAPSTPSPKPQVHHRVHDEQPRSP